MNSIIVWIIFAFSLVCAYCIAQTRWSLRKNLLINISGLVIGVSVVILSGIQTSAVEVFVCLLLYTLAGFIGRILYPLLANILRRIICKIINKEYFPKAYEDYLNEGGGNSLENWVFFYTVFKIMFYFALIAAGLKII